MCLFGYTGIGQGRITNNLEGAPVDNAVFIPDKEAIKMVGNNCSY